MVPAWGRLLDAYKAHAAGQKIDLLIGRRTHRLFRDAGVKDIRVDAVLHVYPPGHDRRPILRDFINNVRDKLIAGGFITESELKRDMRRHCTRPKRLVGWLPRNTFSATVRSGATLSS